MPKYLLRATYATEGVKGLLREGGVGRRQAVKELVDGVGGTLEAFYFAFGYEDVYVIVDLPDNVTAAALGLIEGIADDAFAGGGEGGGGASRARVEGEGALAGDRDDAGGDGDGVDENHRDRRDTREGDLRRLGAGERGGSGAGDELDFNGPLHVGGEGGEKGG